VALDPTSKVSFAELQPRVMRMVAAAFLRRVLEKLPYKGNIVLIVNAYSPHYSLTNGSQAGIVLPAFAAFGVRIG
jgi:hypothetical protein